MKEFKSRVAVVTGAATSIGRGMAETFVAAGMKVVRRHDRAATFPSLDKEGKPRPEAAAGVVRTIVAS
jgi:NAD(P)-dependent dehydrogenase (short-subunit alcohol dehydrogenase family)